MPCHQNFNVRQVIGLQEFALRGTVHVAGNENIFFASGGQDREATLVVLPLPHRRQDRQHGAACGEVHFILHGFHRDTVGAGKFQYFTAWTIIRQFRHD